MKKINVLLFSLFFLPLLTVYSCGGVNQSSNGNSGGLGEDSVYVFDQPVQKDSVIEQPKAVPPQLEAKYYLVQIGAFTTKDKAETFAAESRKILSQKIEISFSSNINLYVVQITPPYNSKDEAEKVRNNLWKNEKFKDAWILTVTR